MLRISCRTAGSYSKASRVIEHWQVCGRVTKQQQIANRLQTASMATGVWVDADCARRPARTFLRLATTRAAILCRARKRLRGLGNEEGGIVEGKRWRRFCFIFNRVCVVASGNRLVNNYEAVINFICTQRLQTTTLFLWGRCYKRKMLEWRMWEQFH